MKNTKSMKLKLLLIFYFFMIFMRFMVKKSDFLREHQRKGRCVKPRLLRQSARVFRKNRPCSAALQGAGHVLLFSFFGKLTGMAMNLKII
ncbi:MAG: hypothetical protein SWH68_13635 [Thermodesulfobacteriota bacterium]|nr:hypothetical protein [Thermodesulfobacteriota bacterium]